MYYYKVWVASQRYHGAEPLTYSSNQKLESGTIIVIPLQHQNIVGVVDQSVSKPPFKTKSVLSVLDMPPLPQPSLKLLVWLLDFYPAPLGFITSQFLPSQLASKPRLPGPKKRSKATAKLNLPPLTNEQKVALGAIQATSKQHSYLLHGDTGTGKTRLYLELAQTTHKAHQDVLVLTPEISLTPQLVATFEQMFPGQVITLHSNLSVSARRSAWLRVLTATNPLVVIGPRSALFAPFRDLGLIVVDEAHDNAYKQEQAPYYQALRVAAKLADIHDAKFIMGTATPNVTDYYIAQAKGLPILRLQALAKGVQTRPNVVVVAAREKKYFTRSLHLSDALLQALEKSLQGGEQSLVFLNRRGTARLVMCQACGWQARCPVCDLPLTYHGDVHIMRCHTCGYKTNAMAHCPVCSSTDIIYKSAGTKSIVDELARLFPKARIKRFDTDNKKAERFEQHYETVVDGKVDMLVGTQLLSKGLDLPKLSVVGVVTADTSLSFPDYTAEERTFQLLTQIIGRVGRGHLPGTAIVQTYNPDSPIIQAAVTKNWQSFYQTQLAERQRFMFPPFCYLLKLTCTRKTQASALKTAQALRSQLENLRLPVQIIGPSPSFYEKTAQGYCWQIIVKAKSRHHLINVIKTLPSGWSHDIDPTNLL